MKATRMVLPMLVMMAVGASAAGANMGVSRGHDLDALWARAQASQDLTRQDAVVLLESREVTVQANGEITTGVHRLVWIGTSLGIRDYADLRVPWNSDGAELAVQILRTWREGQWWPAADRISETAVVHTLPYAVSEAYDYTNLRETMLLHDGVELPCLMETAYTITEHGLPATDGFMVLPQADPAVLVEFKLKAPAGTKVSHWAANAAPEAQTVPGDATSLVWTLRDVPALKRPLTASSAAYEPCVWWSTWASHEVMIDTWRGAFDTAAAAVAPVAAGIEADLADGTLAAAGGTAKVRALARFIEETVRTIHYPHGGWALAPRPADRVWQTAYGHALDKAVLVTGLLRQRGYTVEPVFVSGRADSGPVMLPTLNGLGELQLVVRQPGQPSEAPLVYDPDRGTLGSENKWAGRRVVPMDTPLEAMYPGLDLNLLRVELVLGPDGKDGWAGRGHLDAGGDLAFGDLAAGSSTGVNERLAAVGAAVLPGAVVSESGVQTLSEDRIGAEFALAVAAAEPTANGPESGETDWVIGAPTGGLLSALPGDVQLSVAKRGSPVLLGSRRAQVLVVRCDLKGRTAVHLPAARRLANVAGSFEVSAEVRDGWLHYERVLTLEPGPVAAADWPALRALLLEESDAANGTLRLAREAAAH